MNVLDLDDFNLRANFKSIPYKFIRAHKRNEQLMALKMERYYLIDILYSGPREYEFLTEGLELLMHSRLEEIILNISTLDIFKEIFNSFDKLRKDILNLYKTQVIINLDLTSENTSYEDKILTILSGLSEKELISVNQKIETFNYAVGFTSWNNATDTWLNSDVLNPYKSSPLFDIGCNLNPSIPNEDDIKHLEEIIHFTENLLAKKIEIYESLSIFYESVKNCEEKFYDCESDEVDGVTESVRETLESFEFGIDESDDGLSKTEIISLFIDRFIEGSTFYKAALNNFNLKDSDIIEYLQKFSLRYAGDRIDSCMNLIKLKFVIAVASSPDSTEYLSKTKGIDTFILDTIYRNQNEL